MRRKTQLNIDLKKKYNKIYLTRKDKNFTRSLAEERDFEFNEILKKGIWKNKNVLDVGCGIGQFLYLAAKKGAICTGIDFSKEAIKIAQEKHKHQNLSFQQLDIGKNLPGKYDVIVSLGTLEHQDNPLSTLKMFKKHLNKGGKIIITCPNWTNSRGYILITLYHIFNAPITLADLHYFTLADFEKWAKILRMNLKSKTFHKSWGHGKVMIQDLTKRLPKVLDDAKLPYEQKNIKNLIRWLNEKILPLDNDTAISGATALYIFSK